VPSPLLLVVFAAGAACDSPVRVDPFPRRDAQADAGRQPSDLSVADDLTGDSREADAFEACTTTTVSSLDRSYGSAPLQGLDVFHRSGCGERPIIVIFHGGGWVSGQKEEFHRFVEDFLEMGYVVATPNYRTAVAGVVEFPLPVQDAACAVAWIQDNAHAYGGDPRSIVAMGHSAGAHLAAMIAYDQQRDWLAGCTTRSTRLNIRAFIGSSGVYDLNLVPENWVREQVQVLLGALDGDPLWNEAEPINFVTSDDPSSLIISGDKDLFVNRDVGGANSIALADELETVGVKVQRFFEPDWNHNAFKNGWEIGSSAHTAAHDVARVELARFLQGVFE
jgi:acetyl esterase/lipase